MSFLDNISLFNYIYQKVVAVADLHSIRVNLDPALDSSSPNVKITSMPNDIKVTVIIQKYHQEDFISYSMLNLVTLLNFKEIIIKDIIKELDNKYIQNLHLELTNVNITLPSFSYSEKDISYETHVTLYFSIFI